LLRSYARPAVSAVEQALLDPDALVRFGGVRASETIPPELRLWLVYRMLEDSVKLVRTEAARALASVPRGMMPQSTLLDRVTGEYIASQLINADRPEAHLGVGVLYASRGELAAAQATLETARRLDSAFVPALVNLADLLRVQGREAEGERLLHEAIDRNADNGAAHHALGLSFVRRGRSEEGLGELRAATVADPQNSRFAYVYGVALHSGGQVGAAIAFLEESLTVHPYDLAILTALLSFNRDAGNLDEAIRYAEMWVQMIPDDAQAARELTDLRVLRGG
jgi:tetratricopeptide (TPR) repeat protein